MRFRMNEVSQVVKLLVKKHTHILVLDDIVIVQVYAPFGENIRDCLVSSWAFWLDYGLANIQNNGLQ